jgi:hypothetical protein
MIQFDVAIANAPPILPDNNLIDIYLDTDRDASNGPYGGFEYTIQAVGLVDLFLARWDGTRYVPTSALVLNIWDDRGVMYITIRSTRLGNTTRFRFWVATAVLPAAEDFVDLAPDRGLSTTRFRPRTSPAQMPFSRRSTLAQGVASASRESMSSSARASYSRLRSSTVVPHWQAEQFAAPAEAAAPTRCPGPPAASAS